MNIATGVQVRVRGGSSDSALAEFEQIYRGNVGALTAYFARRCTDPQTVADLTSETVVRAAGSFGRFDSGRGSARAWLFGIAAHVYAQHCAQAANGRDATVRLAGLGDLPVDEIDELAAKIDAHRDDPGDYQLFGIRYLILPSGYRAPVPARLVRQSGPYSLWTTATGGYVHVGTVVGVLSADRSDVGRRSIPLLRSRLAQAGDYLRIAFGRADDTAPPLPAPPREPAAGTIVSQAGQLAQGDASATVKMRRPGLVVLSATYDPGWTATVDGHRRVIEMVAPALVATTVSAGTHRIVFRYQGFTGYPALFALSGLALVALGVCTARAPGRDRGRSAGSQAPACPALQGVLRELQRADRLRRLRIEVAGQRDERLRRGQRVAERMVGILARLSEHRGQPRQRQPPGSKPVALKQPQPSQGLGVGLGG